MLFCIINRQTT